MKNLSSRKNPPVGYIQLFNKHPLMKTKKENLMFFMKDVEGSVQLQRGDVVRCAMNDTELRVLSVTRIEAASHTHGTPAIQKINYFERFRSDKKEHRYIYLEYNKATEFKHVIQLSSTRSGDDEETKHESTELTPKFKHEERLENVRLDLRDQMNIPPGYLARESFLNVGGFQFKPSENVFKSQNVTYRKPLFSPISAISERGEFKSNTLKSVPHCRHRGTVTSVLSQFGFMQPLDELPYDYPTSKRVFFTVNTVKSGGLNIKIGDILEFVLEVENRSKPTGSKCTSYNCFDEIRGRNWRSIEDN